MAIYTDKAIKYLNSGTQAAMNCRKVLQGDEATKKVIYLVIERAGYFFTAEGHCITPVVSSLLIDYLQISRI
jgi:hypothetical protein